MSVAAFREQAARASSAQDLAALRLVFAAESKRLSAFDRRMCLEAMRPVEDRLAKEATAMSFGFASAAESPNSTPAAPIIPQQEQQLPHHQAEHVISPFEIPPNRPPPAAPSVLELQPTPAGEISIENISDTIVYVCAPCKASFLTKLVRCHIFLGPCSGSLLARDLQDCTVHAAARQVRIHTSVDCHFFLRSASGPIIEACSRLVFRALGTDGLCFLGYDSQADLGAGLDVDSGKWKQIKDFSWLKIATPSPNFSIVDS